MLPFTSRAALLRILLLLLGTAGVAWWFMIRMPGKTLAGELPRLTNAEAALREELRADVQKIAGEIGERNVQRYDKLQAAADFIEHSLGEAGLRPSRQGYDVHGRLCENIETEITGLGAGAPSPGSPEASQSSSSAARGRAGSRDVPREIVVIGAHYDSVPGCPGANDNGSGVAALLALARRCQQPALRTLRFVAFANEEPGYFQSELMGSVVYAKACQERGDRIVAMISLETIGYYSNAPGSQKYPAPGLGLAYPTTGNFIGFVGNISSRALVRQALAVFRRNATIPSEGAALPSFVPGIGWSDHWAFWQDGYRAIMITDTAPFRYPHYHASTDTPDKIDYDSMARVVAGLEKVIADLTSAEF